MKFLSIFIISLSIFITPITGAPTPDTQPTTKNHQPSSRRIIHPPSRLSILILTIAAELMVIAASNTTQQKMLEQLAPQKLFKNFIGEYAAHATTTLLHELGHATAARLLTGQRSTIHLGSYEKQKPLIDLGTIKIDGLDPTVGLTSKASDIDQRTLKEATVILNHCVANHLDPTTLTTDQWLSIIEQHASENEKPKQQLKEALFLLAGGCTAIVCHYLIKFLLLLIRQQVSKDQGPLSSAFTIDPIVTEQLITMLWPLKINDTTLSDGGKLWQTCLGVDPKIVKAASSYAPGVELASEVALAYKTAEGQQPSAIDLLIIALINHHLRGYLRFSL